MTTDTFGSGDNQFAIDFVPISAATNPTSSYGIVNYDYRIGRYEITNAQWTKFKAAYGSPTGTPSDAYNSNPYWTASNVPTNNVSWYEAAQFVNWMNTSTGHLAAYKFTGTQGTSDYALGVWEVGVAWGGTNLYRHKHAYYFLPDEHEWVKAAYWNGTELQTYSHASPGDLVSDVPDRVKWNYDPSAGSEPWAVGSGIMELNGTYDMMGNVWEWLESPYGSTYAPDAERGLRGGSYNIGELILRASYRSYSKPWDENIVVGFRVASCSESGNGVIPEPTSIAIWSLIAVVGFVATSRRSRRRSI